MSEGIPEIPPQETPTGDGVNPAWNDVLGVIPKEFHEQVTPHFKNWESGVTSKLQQVQSQYAPYKVYEPFVSNNVPFEEVQQGYGLLRALYEDPAKVITAIQQAFNLDSSPPVAEQEIEEETDYANLPPQVLQQIQRQEQMLSTMGQIMLKQREDAMAASQAQQLDATIKNLKSKHGDFNEEAVLRLALQMNNDIEAAHKYYQDIVQAEVAKRNAPKAPRLLSPGGSAPSNAIDPRKLNPKQTNDLIVDMLKAAQGH